MRFPKTAKREVTQFFHAAHDTCRSFASCMVYLITEFVVHKCALWNQTMTTLFSQFGLLNYAGFGLKPLNVAGNHALAETNGKAKNRFSHDSSKIRSA